MIIQNFFSSVQRYKIRKSTNVIINVYKIVVSVSNMNDPFWNKGFSEKLLKRTHVMLRYIGFATVALQQ